MRTLYKYSSFIDDFFKKPTIKISQPESLNDPFESEVCDHYYDRLINELTIRDGSASSFSIERKDVSNILSKIVINNGVISLSETPRNLLMWAHYGQQHHGMCVGFYDDLLKPLNKEKQTSIDINIYEPIKVNYDSYRVDINKRVNIDNSTIKLVIEHLTTKSDEWIYEKEHRCIIPMRHADIIKLNGNLDERVRVNKKQRALTGNKLISSYLHHNKISAIKNEQDDVVAYRFIKENMEPLDYNMIAGIKNSNLLYEVEASKIESIYLGARVKKEKILMAYNILSSSEATSKIKLYHYTLSQDRFELVHNIVDDEYLQKLSNSQDY